MKKSDSSSVYVSMLLSTRPFDIPLAELSKKDDDKKAALLRCAGTKRGFRGGVSMFIFIES